jgi:hypothetical protein
VQLTILILATWTFCSVGFFGLLGLATRNVRLRRLSDGSPAMERGRRQPIVRVQHYLSPLRRVVRARPPQNHIANASTEQLAGSVELLPTLCAEVPDRSPKIAHQKAARRTAKNGPGLARIRRPT